MHEVDIDQEAEWIQDKLLAKGIIVKKTDIMCILALDTEYLKFIGVAEVIEEVDES